MEPDALQNTGDSTTERRWQPLPSMQRRILGVLVEKAKTTPDAYPLSLNALTTGCNQKSNRLPHMSLNTEQVDEALEQLRHMGAVSEIQGGGRVPKYRHYLKDWLGVEGDELAVVAELLLRGPQTIGELRGRAARMAKIPDLSALSPVLQSLMEKGLVVSLTPEGRGQVVAHALFKEKEMEQLKTEYSGGGGGGRTAAPVHRPVAEHATPIATVATEESRPATAQALPSQAAGDLDALKREMSELKEEVARLRREVEDLWNNLR